MRRFSLLCVLPAALLAHAGPALAQPVPAPVPAHAKSPLANAFALFAKQTDGTVGVAVQSIDGKEHATLNADKRFPMASTFKVAVAGTVFAKIDKGELTLDQMVTIDPKLSSGAYGMAVQTPHPGVALSIHNLLEFMLTQSDNTSTDVLVDIVGGPAVVTAWLRSQGITDQRIDSDTKHIIYRFAGVTDPGSRSFMENMGEAIKADPKLAEGLTPNPEFNADPRDTSTPAAMLQLLLKIEAGTALSAKSTRALIEIMERCANDKRLKGLLPAGTVVAHKTGTVPSVSNDVGIVSLPDGRKFAIAVFVVGDTKGPVVQEKTIADIARVAYDHFLTSHRAE